MENIQKKVQFVVQGMTCASCEQRIENSLSELEGVVNVSASYTSNQVTVDYHSTKITVEKIEKKLAQLHYPVSSPLPQKPWIYSVIQCIVVLFAIAFTYWIIDRFGFFHLFPIAGQGDALPYLFVIGLLTSTHCVAMCGGITLSQCIKKDCAAQKGETLRAALFYNTGRVLSYTFIGGIVGAIGSVVTPSGKFKGVVAIAAAIFMFIMGFNFLGFFPFLRSLIPKTPKKFVKKINREKSGKGPFIVGMLNGLMPCGPLQSMQLFALSTGSVWMGAAAMLIFGLGTAPLLLGLGAISSFLTVKFANIMMKVSAILLLLLALMMLNTGLSLSGIQPIF